jgi:hypothetical protein
MAHVAMLESWMRDPAGARQRIQQPPHSHASSRDPAGGFLSRGRRRGAGVRHRAARLDRFGRRKYERLLAQGFELSI